MMDSSKIYATLSWHYRDPVSSLVDYDITKNVSETALHSMQAR